MPRTSLAQIQQLPDLLSNEHFTFDLGQIPGNNIDAMMTIKVIDAVISGFGNSSFNVSLAGYTRNFRGVKTFGQEKTLSIVYAEDTLMNTYNALRNWDQQIVGTASGTSIGGIADYGISQCYLTIYDQAGNQLDVLTFYNVFILDVQDVQVTGQQQGNAMNIPVSFKFDYYTSLLAPIR
jgi:hypothetical protein